MGNITVEVMPPAYWQDFERLTLDLFKLKWADSYAQSNGRQGQEQAGVDIFGINYNQKEEATGVQCKKRSWKTKPGHDAPSNTLTTSEIDEEIVAARKFEPPLAMFIIATTGPTDSDLQKHVRNYNDTKQLPKVALFFWNDYTAELNVNSDLMYRYYEDVLKYRSKYSADEHYYRMLAMAFDRPAIKTELHMENVISDFIDAIAATQNAISTGRLVDRNDVPIDVARVPNPKPDELIQASEKLAKVRRIATAAIRKGTIKQHQSVIEITDYQVAHQLNTLRIDAITLLNTILESKGIRPLTGFPIACP